MDERILEVDGLALRTRRRAGDAQPPLVLINGIGGSMEAWEPLVAALPSRDIVMIDLPGTGGSALPRRPIRLPAIADYVAGATAALGIEQFDLLGVSFGGALVQEVARRHPAKVRRLILASTTFGLGAKSAKGDVARALLSSRRYYDRERAERDIPLIAGGRTAREPEVLRAGLDERMRHPPDKKGYRYQLWAITGWSSRGWLSDLKLPVLVLHGEEDPAAPVANARRMADEIPGAQLAIVPAAGHLLVHDEPQKAAAIIEPFLTA